MTDTTPVFVPTQAYSWKQEDTLTLSGLELDVLNKAFDALLTSPLGQLFLAAQDGKRAVNSILKRGVEQGTILPVPADK